MVEPDVERCPVERRALVERYVVDRRLVVTRRLFAPRRRCPDRRGVFVYTFGAVLALIAIVVYLVVIRDARLARAPFEVSWVVLAFGFGVSDNCAIHLEAGDDAHSFNLNELPLIIGLFLCDPRLVVLARVLAACVVLAFVQRQTLVKLVFNVCLAAFETVVVVATFVTLTSPTGQGPSAWMIAVGAASTAAVVQTAAIFTAMRLSGGRADRRNALLTGTLGVVSAAATGSLAIATIVLVEVDGAAGIAVMAVIASVLFAAYRGYAVVSQRYANVTKLYGFTKSLARSPEFEGALRLTLLEACDLLRAESAELCLLDPDRQQGGFMHVRCDGEHIEIAMNDDFAGDWLRRQVAVRAHGLLVPRYNRDPGARRYLADRRVRDLAVVPLKQGDAVIGSLAVYNRRGEVSTFDDDDLAMFETFANHASISLENARLIGKLRCEVAQRRHQALHDPLTALGNRTLLAERTDIALAERREDGLVAIVLMDLNRFKDVNDTLGHQHGDMLLCEVAERLRAAVPDAATITRLGGDEFAVLLPQIATVDEAMTVAHRIEDAIGLPYAIDDLHLAVTGSIGVAVAPLHGDDTAALLQHADIAMYQAKAAGDAGVALYDNEQNQHSERRLTLAAELRQAIDEDALEVYYQPKADVATGRLFGVEALLRWHHSTYGPIAPDEFVSLAERTGLIRPITLLVLRHALAQLRSWHDMGLADLRLAVNLSARSLMSADLADDVEHALRIAGIPAHALTLELTETQMMADPSRTVEVLDRLSLLGVDISVDDFGTGYSSLSYLQRLPVDELKIDKSFVFGMTENEAKLKIVQTIIDLGRNLNLRVVAEGIEDAITWDTLASLGCDIGQGYFLSRPIPAAQLTPWLATRLRRHDEQHEAHDRPLYVA